MSPESIGDFLDIYETAEDIDLALQTYWPELDAVLSKPVLHEIRIALDGAQAIKRLVEIAVGGADKLVEWQAKREAARKRDEL